MLIAPPFSRLMVSRYARSAGLDIRRTGHSGPAAGLSTLGLDRSHYQPKEIIMNGIRHIRRIATVLAGLAAAVLLATPAFARLVPDPGAGYVAPASVPVQVQVHTIVAGGMPGWQIALIAIGAALLAATVAVLADRGRAAHRNTIRAAA
jgi:hypothetical protein